MSTETLEAPKKSGQSEGIAKMTRQMLDGSGYGKDAAGRIVPKQEGVTEPVKAEQPKPTEVTPTAPKPESVQTTTEDTPKAETSTEPSKDAGKGIFDGIKANTAPGKPASTKEENLGNMRKIIEEKEAKIKELESRRAYPDDYEKIKEEHSFLASELAKYNVEATPAFKQKYGEPIKEKVALIKKALAGSEVNSEDFIATLNAPDSAENRQRLAEMASGLDDFSKNKLLAAVNDYEHLRDQRDSELKSPTDALSRYKQQEEQERAQQLERFNAVIDDVITSAREKVPFLKRIEGNAGYNKMVETVENNARASWKNPSSPQDQAEMILAAHMVGPLFSALSEAQAQIEARDTELAQYRQSTPDLSSEAGRKAEGGGGGNQKKSAFQLFTEGATGKK